ncbi:MAG: protein-L-isoaspartate O-methyltransferase [Candidatus Nealsonbacteria bacterium CG10_big_fil_rev_8_21_14_0_10_36_24]|uniref:Protein-L-isoaspartate O-methyltransferase n=1 Tax=Candidatus Nealsonbacteria bacterium CG10_big_fil_rev_8_21_14_0_10_36_24 TaxID=1974710 RepID=A0A2M6NSB3_9BACT|nr:MAG: protein-L-isoaspartate O-methyltransferase [Candidatus Nealsonbacteria bacterium CG10_big_fil_rev_8_21_14_0_10_36_24]
MLIDSLIKDGWLKTPRVIEAFRKIKRADFMFTRRSPKGEGGPDAEKLAEINEAFPIGYGQTISQPLTVAFMLEQLQPETGHKILDIGSGSGWTSALLAYIVGVQGKVIAIEIIPELKEFGEGNIAKYNFANVEFICADGSKGYQKEAPFDKILASAAVQEEIPQAWKEQLKVNGRIVTPVRNSIWTLIKKSKKDFEEIEHPGFAFVPLISK